MSRRHVRLEGQRNFRDLGGYRAADGRSLRWGLVYRSGDLNRLSDDDLERLAGLRLRTVIDLRLPGEVESHGADRLPPGARSLALPIDSGDLSPVLHPAIMAGDFSLIPPDTLAGINRSLMMNRCREFSALLRLVSDPANRPLVFHCTHGKDRAGIGAAILLSALGVPWPTVRDDYLLSNVYRKQSNQKALAELRAMAATARGLSPGEIDMSNVEPLYVVSASNLDAAHEAIIDRYGGPDRFLREGLGWSDADLARLRDDLLE